MDPRYWEYDPEGDERRAERYHERANEPPSEPIYSMTSTVTDIPDASVFEMMREYGGSFIRAIGEAGLRADPENKERIKSTWPVEFAKYRVRAVERMETEVAK
jgi:hypothetical protein